MAEQGEVADACELERKQSILHFVFLFLLFHRARALKDQPLTPELCDSLVVDLMTDIATQIKKRRASQHRSGEPVDKALKELEDSAEGFSDRVLSGYVPNQQHVVSISHQELARGLMGIVKEIVWALAKA